MDGESKCPVTGKTHAHPVGKGTSNRDWWPNQVNLKVLHQHSAKSNPMGQITQWLAVDCLPETWYAFRQSRECGSEA
jgi:catalase (peroxidase I)